jgi:hypothetical protein
VALGYVGFRLLEAVLILMGTVSILVLLALRQAHAGGTILDAASLQAADQLLRSAHAWAFILGPNFMLGINTLLYSSLLYQTKLVPRPIAILGLVGALSVFTAALLEMFGVIEQVSAWGAALALPVAIYEMSLAVYLIMKGFKPSSTIFAFDEAETTALAAAHQ